MLKQMKSITLVLITSVAFSFIAGCGSDAQNTALVGATIMYEILCLLAEAVAKRG